MKPHQPNDQEFDRSLDLIFGPEKAVQFSQELREILRRFFNRAYESGSLETEFAYQEGTKYEEVWSSAYRQGWADAIKPANAGRT